MNRAKTSIKIEKLRKTGVGFLDDLAERIRTTQ